MIDIPLGTYEHVQRGKESSTSLRLNLTQEQEQAVSFVMEYLNKSDWDVDNTHHKYSDDFNLDIDKMEKMMEFTYALPSNSEFRAMVSGLPADKVRYIADNIYLKKAKAEKGLLMAKMLAMLDADPQTTMDNINKALQYVVLNGDDERYEDFSLPSFHIINATRYEKKIREISLEENEGKLMQLRGWLTYVQDPPKERIIYGMWNCTRCGDPIEGTEDPKYCLGCKRETKFLLKEKRTEKFQECIITENFEDSGGFPTSLEIIISGEATGEYSPGDRIRIIGYLSSVEEKTKSGQMLFKHVVEVLSLQKEDEKIVFLDENDYKKIEEFKKEGDVLRRLSELYAPQIVGYDYVKQAIILQAAGSPDEFSGGIRKRGQIHILLIGDPGLGKSQLLKANASISRKSLYVSDASAAGLTAAVSDINGRKVMQAGVLVLADRGIACIDEMDKMKREDREGIHTALEQGFISKSKAGLHAHFQSRTSVLAAANPKYGKFDASEPVADQVSIETPLLNRFDLIFLFLDRKGSDVYEHEKAKKILSSAAISGNDPDFIMKYLSVASHMNPKLTENVSDLIAAYYSSARKKNEDKNINPRTLEALKRLTLASSRIRLSETTTMEDFEAAKELVEIYLKQFDYDMDAISGITRSIRDTIIWVRNLIGIHGTIGREEIFSRAMDEKINTRNVERAIEAMYKTGDIFEAGAGRYRVI